MSSVADLSPFAGSSELLKCLLNRRFNWERQLFSSEKCHFGICDYVVKGTKCCWVHEGGNYGVEQFTALAYVTSAETMMFHFLHLLLADVTDLLCM